MPVKSCKIGGRSTRGELTVPVPLLGFARVAGTEARTPQAEGRIIDVGLKNKEMKKGLPRV